MIQPPPLSHRIETARLILRPSQASDAARAFEIQSDWAVTRMLRMAAFPPDREEIEGWFSDHAREWQAGEAFRFAVERKDGEAGHMIGLADIDGIGGDEGELGYWFGRESWGHGFASEAASALVAFAFHSLGLAALRSGRAKDNEASGKVLAKLGFQPIGETHLFSRPRGEEIVQCRYRLDHRESDSRITTP